MRIYWNTAAPGSFGTATNWDPQAVPGANDMAEITPTGSPYTVTSSANTQVLGIATSADATLSIAANTFSVATQGTATGANRGTIDLAGKLWLGGTVNNIGTIQFIAWSPAVYSRRHIEGRRHGATRARRSQLRDRRRLH